MNICIDIETRPKPLTHAEREAIALQSKKNPNRKPDTRAEWAAVLENQEIACEAMALDPSLCRVVVVSMIIDGSEPITYGHWDDEYSVLSAVFKEMARVDKGGPWTFVGHNIAAFDLPILRRACERHGYSPECRALWRAIPTYRFDKRIHDNMVRAMEPACTTRPSAHMLAQSIGVQDKGDKAVVDFPALWAKGADCIPEIMARCEADVRSEWAVFERFEHMRCTL